MAKYSYTEHWKSLRATRPARIIFGIVSFILLIANLRDRITGTSWTFRWVLHLLPGSPWLWFSLTLLVLLLALFQASYRLAYTTRIEYERILDTERAKNGMADFSASEFRECLACPFLNDAFALSSTPGHGENVGSSCILISTYVVNTRPVCVTLRDWKLSIEVNGKIYEPMRLPLDDRTRIKRAHTYASGIKLEVSETEEVPTPTLSEAIRFPQNQGSTVWTAWYLAGMLDHLFKANGKFVFDVTDSTGKMHRFQRLPGAWPDVGKLIISK